MREIIGNVRHALRKRGRAEGRRSGPAQQRRGSVAVGVVLAMVATTGLAEADPLDLLSLQVFATGGIQAERSDYQGPTAAGGTIALKNFDIDGDLTAGGPIRFAQGRVGGITRSSDTRLDRVFSAGSQRVRRGALARASAQLGELAARLSCAPATVAPIITHGTLLGDPVALVRIKATHDLDVVDVNAEDLASQGPNRFRMMLSGDTRSQLVVRVHGTTADLSNIGFVAQGGLTPRQVAFAFPDARSVIVTASGGAAGPDGTHWGVPGSLVAPKATITLAAATITGQVFAASITGVPALPSGQINRLNAPPTQGGAIVSSSVLKRLLGDGRYACDLRS